MSSSTIEPAAGLQVTMPQMGVSVAEGTVVAWHVSVGDTVVADQAICDVSTDKIDTEVPSPGAGVVTEIRVAVDQTVPVGAVLALLDGGAGADTAPVTPAVAPEPDPAAVAPDVSGVTRTDGQGTDRYYSPVVRRIAADKRVDLDQVTGTGLGGRVRKQDVLAAAEHTEPPLHIESPYRPDPVPEELRAGGAAVPQTAAEPTTLSRMRRQIGEHMKRSLETAATCTTWAEADMTAIESTRTGAGLTALPYVARACVTALQRHPALNATFEGDRYVRHTQVNLGIAVSLGEEGLIVPVIHNAQDLSVAGLSARIKELARAARSRTLTPDDTRGGTFTVTNPGQYGSIMATPVINQPQVAILDLEAVVKRPVVVSVDGVDAVAIRAMTILGLSWDHRCLDGVEAARFLADIRRELESVS